VTSGRYQAYPEYKPTGADWLTSVPDSWSVFDGKRIFESCRDPALSSDEQLAASQKFGVVPQSLMMELNDAKVMLALKGTSSFRHVEKHDYVISLRSFEGGIEYSAYTGCVSPAYTVLRTTKPIASGFYKHLFKSRPYISALQATTDSLRDGKAINYEQFGAIPLILPPLPEQTQIAAFLDHETAKIDRLIEKQQALISLLKEKRQAVISHAVTKGLNPHAPLKDSGIEWLGQVPAGWKISELRYEVKPDTSITYGIVQAGPDIEGGIPYIKTSDMSGDSLPVDGYAKTSPAIASSFARSMVAENDIVIAIRATVGKCHLVPAQLAGANLTQGTAKISPAREHSFEFFYWYLSSTQAQAYFDSVAKGATFREITLEKLRKTPIALPPIEEQQTIVSYVRKQQGRFSALVAAAETQTALLQERRTALISAAVTGKIDVRHWQPPLVSELETTSVGKT